MKMAAKNRPITLRRSLKVCLQNYGVALTIALIISLFFAPWWLQWTIFYVGGIAFLTNILAAFVDNWRPKPRVPTQGKAVFITGCDSGFGNKLAQRLDELGLFVFAGCLFPEKEGALSLKREASSRLHIIKLDVTSDDSVEEALQYVRDNIGDQKLWAVVNNAGMNAGAEMMWTPLDVMSNIFAVNTFGVMRVTKAFLPLLCKDKGRIVTVSSAAGRYTYPGMIPYCMTKQATVSFCEGLRIELYRFGVKVVTIEPWMYKTPITDESNVLNYVSKSWEGSSSDVKELYPEHYIERYKKATLKFLRWSISDKPQEVVSLMEEAVLAIEPKYSYMPGTLFSRLTFWFLQRMPKPIADAAIHDECVLKF